MSRSRSGVGAVGCGAPRGKPLRPSRRPYEALAHSGVAALVAGLATWTRDPIGLAVVTGDCIDNAQANELDAYLMLMDGGTFAFPYAGPLEPSWRAAVGAGYVREGLLRSWQRVGEDRRDMYAYSRLPSDLPSD